MQVRILHIDNEDPWVRSNILIDYFGITNPAIKTVDRLSIQNSLTLIENVGWVACKVNNQEIGVSVLFIKKDIENE